MRKLIRLFLVLVSCVLMAGCVTGGLTRLDDVGVDKGIAVAKFRCIYNGQDVTKGCNVVFDPAVGFSHPNQCILDESGYVFAKLPLGTNTIRLIIEGSGLLQHRFADGELTCQISGDGVVNYIGDVTFDWRGITKGSAVAIVAGAGLVGNLFLTPRGQIAVSVKSDPSGAQAAFCRRFSTERKVTTSLLAVRPQQ